MEENYKAALYLRLSKEDKDKLTKGDDSASIQNQRLLLTTMPCSTIIRLRKYIPTTMKAVFSIQDLILSECLPMQNWGNLIS